MCKKLPSGIINDIGRHDLDYCYCLPFDTVVVMSGCHADSCSFGHELYGIHTYCLSEIDELYTLPKQDQLQDVLENVFSNREIVPLTAKFHDVCIHLIQTHNFMGRTMEQLWLSFVMHEKYERIWSYVHMSWLKNEE